MISGIQGGFSSLAAPDLQQMREQMFSRLDPDGDGQIDLEELAAESGTEDARGAMPGEFLEELRAADANGDGLISEEEFASFEPPPPPPPPEDGSFGLFDEAARRAETFDLSGSLLDILG